ncbi:site-specific DNA-methyltransferase [Macrococcoides canis]|uniref:site-specific DNA-methyltransferase n=1 Tax=Macrococcoides canis TaxID=1855823 RepID=UPI00165DDA2D|nr:site-specific DNA-methyltransferase [Macrococcus canis]QNR07142.1 site-specific DNA-methyltransferase [Macrococcus canis]
MNGESLDITKDNIDKLKKIFPEVVTDGQKIDFEKLKTILGEEVEGEKERYSFNWYGKKKTILGAQAPSKGTLRPDKEKSKNFDTTENLYIEGDNLEVLKLLQKSYSNKIKMIYIDPPYNTGKDFVYKDNFRDGVENYLEQTGQKDDEGNALSTNSESNGRFHSDWLNMMFSRLRLAKNLLKKDGLIFISIDDTEYNRLKNLCDEVFNEQNYVATLVWKKKQGGGNDSNLIVTEHEYIILYAKNINKAKINLDKNYELSDKLYPFKDQKGEYGLVTLDKSSIRYSDSLYYEIKDNNGNSYYPRKIGGKQSCWRWSKDKVLNEFEKLVFKNGKIYTKYYRPEGVIPKSLLVESLYGRTESGNDDIKKVFGYKPFSYPKPLALLSHFLSIGMSGNDIVLDFFSGSATTAHATLQLNAEDGGNRRFIMVQLPEQLDEKSEAYKDGYRTICDIGEERIRRAGELVKQELIEKNAKAGMLADDIVDPEQLDIGFKVLKLDKSNIREWNSDFDDLEDNLFAYEDVFVEGRSELDVIYEIMLKNGLELTYTVNQFEYEGKNVYDIAYGNLFVCLADNIDVSVAQAIVEKRNEYGTETSSVVFKDAGFKSDADKLNVIESLKDSGYPEENILTI